MINNGSDDYSKAFQKKLSKAILSCAFWWIISFFSMLIGAFAFLTDSVGLAIAVLIYGILYLLPIFKNRLLQIRSFEGSIIDIDLQRRYKIYMIKPGVGKHAFQYQSEYTIYIQKDNGKHCTVTYRFEESDRPFVYMKGDRVRYRWGVPYMQILSMQKKHATICPFCGHELRIDTIECEWCRKTI